MKNELINVKCVDFTFDGQGLAKDKNKRTYFVPSLLIDEEAEIEVLYHKKDYDIGKIKKITKLSPYRINPKCPCATACGGCSFQNLLYEKELEYKRKVAINTLKSIAKIDVKNPSLIGMEEPYYYRNKIQVLLSMKINAYDEDKDEGILRHVLIRVGKVSKEIMVVLVVKEKQFKNKGVFVKELVKLNPEITTVIYNYNERRTNVILGEKEEVAYGRGFIFDSLLGINFKISSKSFYQVNHDQCEKLYSLAISKAHLTKEDEILDAYCGIGTIGLIASKYVKNVLGVEIVKEAIEDAIQNAKLNNIKNAIFIVSDAKDVMLKKAYDCVFVDPPRKGLDPKFLKGIMNSHPKKIVYISCDVGTLARDLSILKKNYNIESIDFIDMFPRTFHVETVAYLELKR